MHKHTKTLLVAFTSASLVACASVNEAPAHKEYPSASAKHQIIAPQQQSITNQNELTLEKIMADPDWIGRQPQNPYWQDDGNAIFYSQKREGQSINDLWVRKLDDNHNGNPVPLEELHKVSYLNRILSNDRKFAAWVFKGNLFSKNLHTGEVVQLSRDNQAPTRLQFLTDGRLAYQLGHKVYAVDVVSGRTLLLAHWQFADQPQPVEPAKDFLAREQHKLIEVIAKKRRDREAYAKHEQALQQANPSTTPEAFYLPEDHRLKEISMSPNGRWLIIVSEPNTPSRDDSDIMPNYIGEDGRIIAEQVRRRVGDTQTQSESLWLLDLTRHQKIALSYTTLPGYNEDVLAEVKRENAKLLGENYEVNRLPRHIGLMYDWDWDQSAIQWHDSGEQVAIMLEAKDNKDRWLATVDFDNRSLVSQHRLHDDAWVNYNFNEFDWLDSRHELYFLSEQSGYSHLYRLKPGEKEIALTHGEYVVSDPQVTRDDKFIYFKANKKHPGIYEVYRLDLDSNDVEQLTDLNGLLDFVLSPDEQSLLLTHSKLATPPELYVQHIGSDNATRVTHTISDAFASINWVKPQIVPVPSSNTDQPIYSRVYLPENYASGTKHRAVVFSHGAGYLQNAHLGWSVYFREFMFHSYLVSKGFVVLDMDYRASKGYGRDWRTAIYRHMGSVEVEDLKDGVDWLAQNANVDPQRVGHYGGSYGGFLTFMALFKEPDLFKAGAALRPVSDWANYNYGYTSNILNTPEIDPIAYRRSSPIYFAEGLSDPLLINAPMVDNNVFFLDVVKLVQRLIELEKEDFETAIYPVESHGFVQPSSWLDEYRRIYKLMESNL